MFSHIYRIALIDGVVRFLYAHSPATIDDCAAHPELTTKRGKGTRNSVLRIRELINLGVDLGIVVNRDDMVDLTPDGRRFVEAGTEPWNISPRQAGILREILLQNPHANSRSRALFTLLRLVSKRKTSTPMGLMDEFAEAVGAKEHWKQPITRKSATTFALHYLREIGLVAKRDDTFVMTADGKRALTALEKFGHSPNIKRRLRVKGAGRGKRTLVALRRRLRNLLGPTEVDQISKRRIGQAVLRSILLRLYRGRCALCETRQLSLLRASHVKAWSWSTSARERLDPANAILLCVTHDALFDCGLIGFTDNLRLVVSPSLNLAGSPALIPLIEGAYFSLPTRYPPRAHYLAEHRRRYRLGDEMSPYSEAAVGKLVLASEANGQLTGKGTGSTGKSSWQRMNKT